MKTKLLIISIIMFNTAYSQWSTTTDANSALYICPGFEPGILSLDDGSCYIAGGLSDYLYVQKIDPEGYKLWPQPVMVFGTPGTDNGEGNFTMVSDGLGGLIFVWKDNRGAYIGPDDYYNNAVYMQRVDKDGNIIWQTGGIQIDSVSGGNKEATIVNDGSGGAIIMLAESDFRRPDALKKEWTWIKRYDRNGKKIWDYPVDSSDIEISIYPPHGIIKMDSIFLFQIRSDYRFIDTNGIIINTVKYLPKENILNLNDSLLFDIISLPTIKDSIGNNIFVTRVTRFSSELDSLWSTDYEMPDEADPNEGYGRIPYVSDGNGGFFICLSFRDINSQRRTRIQNITPNGARWENYGLNIYRKSAYTIFSGKNEIGIIYSDASAQKYDLDRQPIWRDSVVVFSNPSEAYFKVYASDNNGGCIIAFWTTAGGIYAQHTGRNGKLGIVTKVNDITSGIPISNELYQNYPNPFNNTTQIKYTLNRKSRATLKIYDILGREIMTAVDKEQNRGTYLITLTLPKAASGIYFYRLAIEGQGQLVRKLMLIK